MKLLKERDSVYASINIVYIRYTKSEICEEGGYVTTCLFTKAKKEAIQNYLRSKLKDNSIIVLDVRNSKTEWQCALGDFLSIANQIDGETYIKE